MSHVSIGLPVYNGAAYLEKAVESLLNQSHDDFDLLISDNASTDATGEIGRALAQKDPRITYHRHGTNLGAAPNFNFCVDHATGPYFKWMAHDDLCTPTYLERCIEVLDSSPDVTLCQARAQRIDGTGAHAGSYTKEWDFNGGDPVTRFARAMAYSHSCVTVFGVMRLDILRQTPAIASFVGSDRPLLAELALHGRLEYVPEELFLWRDHQNRSVRINHRRNLLAWFDSNAKSTLSTLFLRQLLANQKAVFRVPLSPWNRARAIARTLQWSLTNYRRLGRDIRTLGGAALRSCGVVLRQRA